uniref:Endoglucanase n=1 Tax=Phallusia mammillata TaxID=59560 RepID=A0A6F9DI08_9ASCI|nr:uncharacterized protein LOC100180615 [Phallusia mammillata]
MMHSPNFAVACVLILCSFKLSSGQTVPATFEIKNEWPGEFRAEITFPLTQKYSYGWMLYVTFDIPVDKYVIDETRKIGVYPDKTKYVFLYHTYNKLLDPPASRKRSFQSRGRTPKLPKAEVLMIPLAYEGENVRVALNRAINGVTEPPRPSSTTTVATTEATPLVTTTTARRGPWWDLLTTTSAPITVARTTRKASTTQSTTVEPPNLEEMNLRYNLRDVITKSLLFFESQRSGFLPPNNRIPWRSHSALRDGFDVGQDLSGGYYIDGGYVKYGFPMAFSTTMMAWGLLEFRNAYLASYQIPHAMNALKWATDYFIKCHVSKFEFYGQISTPKIDGEYWGRAEDIKKARPSFKITRFHPGSDLAAETAAALAATAMVFKSSNITYHRLLIKHAKELFQFADKYRGSYHESITEATQSFKSWSGFWDELGWGALWLYKATGEDVYLNIAKNRLDKNPNKDAITTFNWDDKRIGALVLLAELTDENKYKYQVSDFCDAKLPAAGGEYTPNGLLYISEWGPNRHAANIGVICLMVAKLGLRSAPFRRLAHSQLSYILGDGGRSFVVGFGENSPQHPHHRGSSCPDQPAPCTFADKEVDRVNPQPLVGAMVGGPDKFDNYVDSRDDYQQNGVAIDYNAGLQTLAAGILELQVTGQTFSEPNPEELQSQILQNFAVKHDYNEVLHKSLLFYEAQRAGELPPDNRIPWRKSAFVNDKGIDGEDLSGGYFDAGDYMKFNFPMAYTTTILAWGILQYGKAYEDAGEMENARKAVKWATDYFIKCHVAPYEFYGQVGNGELDHNKWTTPDKMESVKRPAYKLTSRSPGSDLVGEAAAAMAAASLVFRSVDSNYSSTLLTHARQLHDFAVKYIERYHRSIRDAAQYYQSRSGFEDELAWASTWLYLATNERSYLSTAQTQYRQIPTPHSIAEGFNWDQKTPGVQLLLAQITKSPMYIKALRRFCNGLQPDQNIVRYTPRGLIFINKWGPLRHAAGVSYICMGAANLGIEPETYRDFAKRQIHYMLGDSGLGSYVVGYGPNPPTRPHHRASSCPDDVVCGYEHFSSELRNPHVLYGALVGGPDINDQYTDDRKSFEHNEVALDYNACFQSAIAGLKYLELYPPLTTTPEPNTATTTTTVQTTTPVPGEAPINPEDLEEFFENNNNIDWGNYGPGGEVVANTTVMAVSNGTAFINQTLPNNGETNMTAFATTTVGVTTSSAAFQTTTQPLDTTYITSATTDLTTLNPTSVSPSTSQPVKTSSIITRTTTSVTPVIVVLQKTTTEAPKDLVFKGGICDPMQVFDFCAIERRKFLTHPARQKYECRYTAFEECADKQGATCDNLWSFWNFWNNDASYDRYFTELELKCKKKEELYKQKCFVRGIQNTFNECNDKVQFIPIHPKESNVMCRWHAFQNCTNEQVGHCLVTWNTWKYWNFNKGKPHFTPEDRTCSSAVIRPTLWLINIIFVFYFTQLV